MITKQELDAANREAEQAHDNAERFRTPVKFTQEEWNKALENVIKLQADLAASQNNLANAEQEVKDLKALLSDILEVADLLDCPEVNWSGRIEAALKGKL